MRCSSISSIGWPGLQESHGMVGGQVVDIESEGKEVDLPTLQYIHTHKTGAMILVSVQVGARLGGARRKQFQRPSRVLGSGSGLLFKLRMIFWTLKERSRFLGKTPGKRSFEEEGDLSFGRRPGGIEEEGQGTCRTGCGGLESFWNGGGPSQGNRPIHRCEKLLM